MYVVDNTKSIKDLSYENNSDDDMLERITDPFYKKNCARTRIIFSRNYRNGRELTVVRKLSSYKGNINILSEFGLFIRKATISGCIHRSPNKGIRNIAKEDYMTDNEYTEGTSEDILTKYKKRKKYKRKIV